MNPATLTMELKAEAARLGFDLCGIAPAAAVADADYFQRWLAAGQAGDMTPWLAKNSPDRANPAALLADARSVIVLGLNYHQTPPPRRGRIARYALGRDYHDLIPPKLEALDRWLQQRGGTQRRAVDTSALMEKPLAVSAGLGWLGKNTMLVQRRFGAWIFLAELITSLALPPDPPAAGHCGHCARCLGACPTGAITAPYRLDARRCIAYLTIEHQGAIPPAWREKIGDHLFGCDDCLAVCPWNRWARPTREAALTAQPYPDLREMLYWDDARFRAHFRGTPIFRLKHRRWLRNISVVLGNIGVSDDLPALRHAAADRDPLIAEHAAWAIGQITGSRLTNGSQT
ncbi:MAG: tRNA epoxyqueuosine(34) reductase QueG [Verrucomicrobiales bacterium]|jgi:epoxyqueuosine reductase|nr:tRNA epoxyqueuosine(34) reductase QueG [Verrucomicrobiales bacterium]